MNVIQNLNLTLLKPVIKKKLFGKEYVSFIDYIIKIAELYGLCALMGSTFKENIHSIVKLISTSDQTDEPLSQLEKMALKRINKSDDSVHNFLELILVTELPDLLKKLFPDKSIKYNLEGLIAVSNEKVPLEFALYTMQLYSYEALGFGYKYSELTEKYLTSKIDIQEWNAARKSGLNIPDKPENIKSIEDQQNDIKHLIKSLILKQKPELIEELGLNLI